MAVWAGRVLGRFTAGRRLVGCAVDHTNFSLDALIDLEAGRALAETDPSNIMEGLYIKVEEEGVVQARYKYVRPSFLTAVSQSGSHWLSRPIIPNQLADGVDIFAPDRSAYDPD